MSGELEPIKRELKIVRNQLSRLLNKQAKETWVGASVVTAVTGWEGRNKLRWARENGLVKYDSEKGYLLESIPDIFIKTIQHDRVA